MSKIPIIVKPKVLAPSPPLKLKPIINIKPKDDKSTLISNASASSNTSASSNNTMVLPTSLVLDVKDDNVFLHPDTEKVILETQKNYALISLLKNSSFDVKNENMLLINQFKLLATQIEHQIKQSANSDERRKHGFRLSSIKKATEIFEHYPGKIVNGAQAKLISGIGDKISARIDEILKTGTLAELTEKKTATDYTDKVMSLCTVTGIGDVKARELVNKYDFKDVDDLIKRWKAGEIKVGKNELTHHIEVGLRWYYDIKQKISRSEMDLYSQLLQEKVKLLDKSLKVQVCGSYRREKPFSSDIDVLLTHPSLITIDDINKSKIKYLLVLIDLLIEDRIIVDSLTDKGETKYMGVVKLPTNLSNNSVGRRIDIRFVAYESWAAAQFYFTGSGHFNKIFRGIAVQRGYTVNEYGIYKLTSDGKKGDMIPTFSEKQIFDIVGVDYLTPKQRDL